MLTITAGSAVRLLGQFGEDLSGRGITFSFEALPDARGDAEGYVIAVNGGAPQTRPAVILNGPGGEAYYTLTSAETSEPGRYRGLFFYEADGVQRAFPANGYIEWDVVAYTAPAALTWISDFYDPIRAVMGDFRAPLKYEDASLASVVRTVVRCGHVPGYTVSADGRRLAPAMTEATPLALVTYWSARTLLRPNVREEAWGSRALKVRRGNQRDFLQELEVLLYHTENPTGLVSFQSYYAWVNALAGVNVWGLMTEMKVNAPVATAIIGTGGIQMNTT